MDFIIGLFVFFTLIVILAWTRQYRLSIILFIIFLIAASVVFMHHVTDPLQVAL